MKSESLTEADLKLLRDALGDSPGARLIVELASLRSEVAELRKDASRYRWLREGDNDEYVIRGQGSDIDPFLLRMGSLDAAIDALMKDKAGVAPLPAP